jgi:hypothetical protein
MLILKETQSVIVNEKALITSMTGGKVWTPEIPPNTLALESGLIIPAEKQLSLPKKEIIHEIASFSK